MVAAHQARGIDAALVHVRDPRFRRSEQAQQGQDPLFVLRLGREHLGLDQPIQPGEGIVRFLGQCQKPAVSEHTIGSSEDRARQGRILLSPLPCAKQLVAGI